MTTQQPTNNPLDHAPVDVLAVMDFRIDQAVSNWRYHGQDDGPEPDSIIVFRQARAAIAELIACAQRSAEILERVDDPAACGNAQRLRAALARVGSAGGAL